MANFKKIKEIAKKRQITLAELCERVGITQVGLSKIMRDNATTTKTLEGICAVLECSPEEFIDVEASVSVSSIGDNNNVVGKGTISTAKDIGKALDILHEQLNRKDEQINGLIQALNR